MILKAIGIWLLILDGAVLNGGFREAILMPKLGNPVALVLSGLLLSVCINIWPLVLVIIFIAPLVAVRLRG